MTKIKSTEEVEVGTEIMAPRGSMFWKVTEIAEGEVIAHNGLGGGSSRTKTFRLTDLPGMVRLDR